MSLDHIVPGGSDYVRTFLRQWRPLRWARKAGHAIARASGTPRIKKSAGKSVERAASIGPARKTWSKSVKAYRNFQKMPMPVRLRHTFEEMLSRQEVWTLKTGLQFPYQSYFLGFEDAMAAGDVLAAQKIGRRLVGSVRKRKEQGAARLVLAARALYAHDNLALADWLLRQHRDRGEEALYEYQMERFLLALRHEATPDGGRTLLQTLLRHPRTNAVKLAFDWMRYRWLYEGPSAGLLATVLQIARELDEKGMPLLVEGLALAFLLNDLATADDLLRAHPALANSFDGILPLADYLCLEGPKSALAEQDRVADYAGLYRQLLDGTALLQEILADNGRTLAIVGNSPCEIGLGRGPLIDSHDVVARFNHFSVEEQFAGDYGKKCTIHVRLPLRPGDNERSAACAVTVLNRADLLYRQRYWGNVLALSRSGTRLACFPTGFHQPLFKELKAEPSAGLSFCALAQATQGNLARGSCFGFSFVDQVGENATSAHYFRQARPSFKHRWREERYMFERMTKGVA